MSVIEMYLQAYRFHRTKTLSVLDKIEKDGRESALAWRPGVGRAPIAWQLMHIGVTEEIFATERLAPGKQGQFVEFWPRYRGGSTPDDAIPTVSEIRGLLQASRIELEETLRSYDDSRLAEIPSSLAQRGWTVLDVLHVIGWHESHHHGQAHITYNLYCNSMV